MTTDVLTIDDLTPTEIGTVLDRAHELKAAHHAGRAYRHLPEYTLAMLFEQPSTRTRVSFETGMTRLGGHAIMLNPQDMQLDRGEPIKDTARSLARYVDAVMIRMADHSAQATFADYSSVPTINALSDDAHPCQTLADLFTIRETFGDLDRTVAWVGDGNNVARSFIVGASMLGCSVNVATPPGHWVGDDILDRVAQYPGTVTRFDDPGTAVDGADVVYTDVWVSMSDDPAEPDPYAAFDGFQVNEGLLAGTAAKVMHCLPAHRGEEITESVLEGDQSIVWQQAENRLHAQNGLLVELLAPDSVHADDPIREPPSN